MRKSPFKNISAKNNITKPRYQWYTVCINTAFSENAIFLKGRFPRPIKQGSSWHRGLYTYNIDAGPTFLKCFIGQSCPLRWVGFMRTNRTQGSAVLCGAVRFGLEITAGVNIFFLGARATWRRAIAGNEGHGQKNEGWSNQWGLGVRKMRDRVGKWRQGPGKDCKRQRLRSEFFCYMYIFRILYIFWTPRSSHRPGHSAVPFQAGIRLLTASVCRRLGRIGLSLQSRIRFLSVLKFRVAVEVRFRVRKWWYG
jgi:hypothetical protein